MDEWETKPEAGGAVHEFVEALGANMSEMLPKAWQRVGGCDQTADAKTELIVAFSGGPDSTALLFALHMVARRLNLSLRAVHVNHRLRGAESDEDELFCRRVCERLHVEYLCLRPERGGAKAAQSENDFREDRYKCLSIAARQSATNFIVLAHTLDDQVETLLFRLCRGTSLAGLVGMQTVKLLDNGVVLLRPALAMTRHDCLKFLASLAVSAREDSSNSDTKFSRNFIRHELIPMVEARFPGFRQRVERFRSIVADEEEFMNKLAEEELQRLETGPTPGDHTAWSRSEFASMHAALRRRVVAAALGQRGVERTFERVQSILAMFEAGHETGLSLDSDWDVRIDRQGNLVWVAKHTLAVRSLSAIRVRIPGTTLVPVLGRALRVESLDAGATKVGEFPLAHELDALVDFSSIEPPLFLRQRREGDFIQPFGMHERVKLKKYLHTHKSGEDQRLPLSGLLLAHEDEILWVPGVGLSERLRVREQPSHRLTWLELADDFAIG